MVRAPCCEKMGLKKGPWTPAEDQVLIAYIQRYGHGNWRALPKQAGLLRCGKSCRLRWTNYLRPDIKRGNFSQEEEETIIKLHEMLGNRWSAIAARLPGRTDNEIKNVWHTYLKKSLKQNPAPETHRKPMETSEYNMNPKKESTLHNTEPQSPTTAHHRLENPSQLPVSPSQSSTDFPSSANTDSSFFTCETQITAATTTGEDEGSSESAGCFIDNWLENFAGIDDFFTDALPEENPSCIDVVKPPQQQMEFPCSPISSWPYSPYNDDSMDFWFNVLMEAGQVPVIEEF